jgi:hypothetical protein
MRRSWWVATAACAVLLGSWALSAPAQITSFGPLPDAEAQDLLGRLRSTTPDVDRTLSERNAELLPAGPVDPDTYLLGPGDLLALEVIGAFSLSVKDEIGADGSITFPQLGTFDFGGRTLREARVEIEERGRSLIRESEIRLVLRTMRTFKVFVTGEVMAPVFATWSSATGTGGGRSPISSPSSWPATPPPTPR